MAQVGQDALAVGEGVEDLAAMELQPGGVAVDFLCMRGDGAGEFLDLYGDPPDNKFRLSDGEWIETWITGSLDK